MFLSLIDNIVGGIALGPQRRKVKKYLDEATCDSVCTDLGKLLSPLGWRERELLRATFDMYCIEDSAQEKFWNEESFRRHVRSRYPATVICDAAIQLLWRSFHFYAYHPFPRDIRHAKVDYDAFQRAALLIVFQCDGFLGTRELDWFWRNDAAFFRKASLERIFRSIALPENTAKEEISRQLNSMISAVSDVQDVLIMVGPQFMHTFPTPEQLETVPRRLFGGRLHFLRGVLRREEVSTLISLLLRMRLSEEKWCSFYTLSDIVEVNPGVEDLTTALVDSIIENESEHIIISERLLTIMGLMPNIQLRFYQLWAALFQPSGAAERTSISRVPGIVPSHILGAISLFAPDSRMQGGHLNKIDMKYTRIALEGVAASGDSYDTTVLRLTGALSNCASGCVVLFSGRAVATSPKTVIGVYLSGPPQTSGTQAGIETRESGSNTTHVLFQLQPSFRLSRWTESNASLSGLIKAEQDVSLGENTANEYSESSSTPYWIGDPVGQSTRLRVDTGKKTVTLTSGDKGWRMNADTGVDDTFIKNCTVTIQNAQMDVFKVVGLGT
ncbi:hypothetical protein F5Y12DRAFT_747890 [Xylaria sp. FL1777]|nr:hypothetical protein F5Y12DRAFT_747890 [Xylaria sp. FL1777]